MACPEPVPSQTGQPHAAVTGQLIRLTPSGQVGEGRCTVQVDRQQDGSWRVICWCCGRPAVISQEDAQTLAETLKAA